ncbi:MAG TPA: CehA/McbA family metallohydrolase [Opitutaceae bacterium]
MTHLICLTALGCIAAISGCTTADSAHTSGMLELSITDGAGGQETAARVELLDANGKTYIATDALLVGPGYADRTIPWQGDIEKAKALLSQKIENPFTHTTQFYSDGSSTVALPPGTYKLRVYKGIEFKLGTREIEIRDGETVKLDVPLERWVNMQAKGWFSSDDHLHISRPVVELNPILSKWMQAEDINVANLLQFGTYKAFTAAPQYEHGPDGVYREGDYLLVSGQENPRGDFLGHGIVLGARTPIHFPDEYLLFRKFWEEARKQGALSGYAHWGMGSEAQTGLALDLPTGLLDFLEVMECWDANYDVWYEILNAGIRMAPTAGTDYGTLPNLPGRERFYTAVKGPLTVESWLDGIRRGETFVTNGPMLELTVDDAGMGGDVVMKKPGTVRVRASMRFDPERDDMFRIEVVRNGVVVKIFPRIGPTSEVHADFELEVDETCWLAVRAYGIKAGEFEPPDGYLPPWRNRKRDAPASLAHTAAIHVTVEGTRKLEAQDRAKAAVAAWLARLDELEQMLIDENLKFIALTDDPYKPDMEYLLKNRPALLEAIERSRRFYRERTR